MVFSTIIVDVRILFNKVFQKKLTEEQIREIEHENFFNSLKEKIEKTRTYLEDNSDLKDIDDEKTDCLSSDFPEEVDEEVEEEFLFYE